MAKGSTSLEVAIAAVAAHAKALGVHLTRTKVVKLLYLVDVKAWEATGRTLTGVQWMWHHYGPYSRLVVETCARMAERRELVEEKDQNYYGSPEYRIMPGMKTGRLTAPLISALVRDVVAEYGRLSPSLIAEKTYETEPMRRVVREGNRGEVIVFPAAAPPRSEIQRIVARYADLARESEGFDEGAIAEGLREEIRALAPAKAKAVAKLLDDE